MQFDAAKDFILSKLASELPVALTYHSLEHINDVYAASGFLASREGVTGEDLQLLLMAALFHDAGFTIDPEDHETLSCQIARTHLPFFDFNAGQVEQICEMIMATRIPQAPKNKLAEILCDADLDYLGRDDFFETGEKLYREFLFRGVVKNEEEWNRLQIRFLESHHYFTTTAIQLRKQRKDEYLRQIRSRVQAYS